MSSYEGSFVKKAKTFSQRLARIWIWLSIHLIIGAKTIDSLDELYEEMVIDYEEIVATKGHDVWFLLSRPIDTFCMEWELGIKPKLKKNGGVFLPKVGRASMVRPLLNLLI